MNKIVFYIIVIPIVVYCLDSVDINKFFKKHKIKMTYKDFEKVQNNPEEIMKIFKIK